MIFSSLMAKEDKRPIDMVIGFHIREATTEEAREMFPKDYAAEELAPILAKIDMHKTVVVNAPRSFILAATAILKGKMRFKVRTDSRGTWVKRMK